MRRIGMYLGRGLSQGRKQATGKQMEAKARQTLVGWLSEEFEVIKTKSASRAHGAIRLIGAGETNWMPIQIKSSGVRRDNTFEFDLSREYPNMMVLLCGFQKSAELTLSKMSWRDGNKIPRKSISMPDGEEDDTETLNQTNIVARFKEFYEKHQEYHTDLDGINMIEAAKRRALLGRLGEDVVEDYFRGSPYAIKFPVIVSATVDMIVGEKKIQVLTQTQISKDGCCDFDLRKCQNGKHVPCEQSDFDILALVCLDHDTEHPRYLYLIPMHKLVSKGFIQNGDCRKGQKSFTLCPELMVGTSTGSKHSDLNEYLIDLTKPTTKATRLLVSSLFKKPPKPSQKQSKKQQQA